MVVKLVTVTGELVSYAGVLPFAVRPRAVVWGTRFFLDTGTVDGPKGSEVEGPFVYAEAFVAPASFPETGLADRATVEAWHGELQGRSRDEVAE